MKKTCFLFSILLCLPLFLVGCSSEEQLSTYVLAAEYDDQLQTLSCSEQVCYVNSSDDALSEICFYVYANAFNEVAVSTAYLAKAYPNGESFGGVQFTEVLADGAQAEWALDEAILTVSLPETLHSGESVLVQLQFVVSLANVRHRLGYAEDTVNFGNVFPLACVRKNGEFVKTGYAKNGDPFCSEVSNFEVTISYPSDYVFASTGDVEISSQSGTSTAVCTAEKVRDFCFVLSKKFQTISTEVDGTQVSYFFYDDDDPQAHLATAAKALETFGSLFGAYPYHTLAVVQADFCFGGMEYPNLVLIADDSGDATDYVIVHEIAHQWWYGVVGSNQWEEAWMDEGLTEFSTALFFEENEEYGLEYSTIMENALATYQNFVRIYEKVLGSVDESMNRTLAEFSTEPEYVNIAYTKGMLLFDALRQSMSEKKFFKCLQQYYQNFAYKNATSADLIESFSRCCGVNLESFFRSWLNGEVKLGM